MIWFTKYTFSIILNKVKVYLLRRFNIQLLRKVYSKNLILLIGFIYLDIKTINCNYILIVFNKAKFVM